MDSHEQSCSLWPAGRLLTLASVEAKMHGDLFNRSEEDAARAAYGVCSKALGATTERMAFISKLTALFASLHTRLHPAEPKSVRDRFNDAIRVVGNKLGDGAVIDEELFAEVRTHANASCVRSRGL